MKLMRTTVVLEEWVDLDTIKEICGSENNYEIEKFLTENKNLMENSLVGVFDLQSANVIKIEVEEVIL